MATVPHSQRLTAEIKANATKPFDTAMAEVTRQIRDSHELCHLVRLALAPQNEVAMAEELHALNDSWMQNWYSNVTFIRDRTGFGLDMSSTPLPRKMHQHTEYQFDDPDVVAANPELFAKFMEYYKAYERAMIDKRHLEAAIENVIDATPTIQRAAEAMPNIINWLPDEARIRYNAVNPKRSNTRASAADIAADALTPEVLAAMARARMLDP